MRLCRSRLFFTRAYPRETQEMVLDAYNEAFRFFGGVCRRGIYDNMRMAVDAVFVGRERHHGGLLDQQRNLIVVGGTGTMHVAVAIASNCVRRGRKAR